MLPLEFALLSARAKHVHASAMLKCGRSPSPLYLKILVVGVHSSSPFTYFLILSFFIFEFLESFAVSLSFLYRSLADFLLAFFLPSLTPVSLHVLMFMIYFVEIMLHALSTA